MRTRTTAFTVTFTAGYCTQDHTHSSYTDTKPSFPACQPSKSRGDTQSLALSQRTKRQKKTKYIHGERRLSPVCPGRRARPWPGSGACSGSPWCWASCRAPSASSPASGCTPPWDRCEAAAAHGPGWCTRSPAGGRQRQCQWPELPGMEIR